MKTQIIEDWAALKPLEPEWNALLQRSRADSLFLRWEWIDTWQTVVGNSASLLVVTVRDEGGALVGVAPFYVTGLQLGRIVPYRLLRILGVDHSGAEYPDWIVREDRERDVPLAITGALAAAGDRWDCIWMPFVPGWTGARERIVEACTRSGFYCHERSCDFSAIELPAAYWSYEQCLSAGMRAEIRKRRRDCLSLPDVAVVQCESEKARSAFLDALFHLNHQRWSTTGQAGTFVRKPREAHFYREFTRVALERGWLRLLALTIGGEFKAVQIGYVYNRTFYSLQEGFDPKAPPGIGNVLRSTVIEQCIAEGVRTYDFLGGLNEHKRRWLAKLRSGHDLFIGRKSLKNRLLFSAEVWPTGRYLRPSGLPSWSPHGIKRVTCETCS